MESAQNLSKLANLLRKDVLKMVVKAKAGHVAGPLSSAEMMAVLYFSGLVDLGKDKIVLSCGHYAPLLYAALARADFFPLAELDGFMQIGSRLPGHPERGLTPGIEVSSGPLGQGVSVATGQALALKMRYGQRSQVETPRVYCLLSDGEIQEGQVWEAFNFAARRQLDNLIYILDRNKIQIENYVSQLATYGEVEGRLESFGLYAITIDGNDIEQVQNAIRMAHKVQGKPVIIVMNTVGGKGVGFMENKPLWHDKVPTQNELSEALKELDD